VLNAFAEVCHRSRVTWDLLDLTSELVIGVPCGQASKLLTWKQVRSKEKREHEEQQEVLHVTPNQKVWET